MKLFRSLTNRIFLACAVLAVLSVATAIYVVNVQVAGHAEAEIERGLNEAAGLVDQYRSLLFENVIRQARLLADLPRFKAAVALDDPPTLLPVAQDYQKETAADLMVVTNGQGRVLAYIGQSRIDESAVPTLMPITQALAGRQVSSFWPAAEGVLQVTSVPIWIDREQPEILGSLSVGFALDRALAERFRTLIEGEVFFIAGGRIQASTEPQVNEASLGPLVHRDGLFTTTIGENEYVGLSRSIAALAPGPPVLGGEAVAGEMSDEPARAPRVVILRSRTESLRFLNSIHTVLIGTMVAAVLAAIILSYGVARTVTRPIGAIIDAMRRMAATGELTPTLSLPPPRAWSDEDARLLASTLTTMTQSIARFQREAALRERLSSLGRLSTVVAHEIRNPLMIIKTALRTLRRAGATTDETRTAVDDIDQEVVRLNRIVGEVLDFARPIRFEFGEVVLNALCEDAAAASAAGESGPTVQLHLDPAAGTIETDAERLRLVLVNILTNSRHAVIAGASAAEPAANPQGPPGLPPIQLTTERQANERVAIVVQDRGIGIDAEDLPRVFEPYFTRKRTGSGLGLAIAKNVVDGLGGTITAASGAGAVTEIRIELPVRRHVAGAESAHRSTLVEESV